jgi:predicted nicotinamide N-methyase
MDFSAIGGMTGFIDSNTVATCPLLCPEIRLRLITDRCRLWKAGEMDLEAMGLPAPFWGFCWAGGQALARHVLDNPEMVRGRRVLDFGSGCGVLAIAAKMCGAASVLAADTDPFAAEAVRMNARLNGIEVETTTVDLLGRAAEGFDVILAGDMFYDAEFSGKVISWLGGCADGGAAVYAGDAGRGNVQGDRMRLVKTYMAPADVDAEGRFLREAMVYFIERKG